MMNFKYLLVVGSFALISSGAYAGATQPAPVDVDLGLQSASGDMVTARYSNDKNEFIGCGSRHFDDGVTSFSFGFCQAEDQDGDQFVCVTQNADLLDRIDGISDFSFITFGWNAAGDCTRIGFSTQSFYLPKDLNANKNSGGGNGDN
jgi:hypothetical protein